MADSESNTDYVTVVGPDKKTYRFPKGTDKAAAIGYFKRKGIGVAAPAGAAPTKAPGWPTVAPASATPPAAATQPAAKPDTSIAGRVEPYRQEIREGVKRGVTGAATGLWDIGKAIVKPDNPLGVVGDVGMQLKQMLDAGARSAESGEGRAGQTLSMMENAPFVGPAVRYAETGGTKAFNPKSIGAATELSTYYAAPAMTADLLGITVDKVRDAGPAALRRYAAKLDTRVLRQADEDARDYKKSAALQVANEGIIGRVRSLPDKIEKVRSAKDVAVKQLVARAEQAGTTVDVSQDIAPIVRDAVTQLNQQGKWNPSTKAQMRALLNQIATETDLKTGQRVPVDLKKLTPSKTLALIKGLEDPSNFNKSTPTQVNNFARRLRGALNDRLGQQLPDVQRLRAEESRLITARDSARTNYAQLLNGKYKMINGIIYGDIGYIPLWLALKESGLGFGAATGGIVMLKALMDNAPSRTARAALAAKLANVLERSKTALQAPQGAAGPSAGGSAITGPNAPTGPANAPNAGLTAPPAQLGPGAPAGGTAPGGTVGSAAGAALDTALFQQARAEKGPNASLSEVAQRAQELKLQHVAGTGQSVAQSNISSPAGAEPDVEMLRRLGTTEPPAPLRPKPAPDRLGTPEQERRMRESMVSREAAKKDLEKKGTAPAETTAKNKAMLDRLDVLFERRDKPKSGADRIAIQREIAEIRKVLEGNVTPQELSKINKHIADRERLATKRAEAKPPETGTMAGGEAVAQGTSPEEHAITMDMGYKRLAQFEGGPELVKALKKLAKDMSKVDPTYDEMTALTDAIMALKEAEGQ